MSRVALPAGQGMVPVERRPVSVGSGEHWGQQGLVNFVVGLPAPVNLKWGKCGQFSSSRDPTGWLTLTTSPGSMGSLAVVLLMEPLYQKYSGFTFLAHFICPLMER
jgi:hypothetical protein